MVQLEASKSSIKDLFKDLWNYRFQILNNSESLLRKPKENGDIEYAPVYSNSTTKTVIKSKYVLDKSFQKVLYRIDDWINEESGWVVKNVDKEYENISIFSPL